jgi:CIC family chloride channel protein
LARTGHDWDNGGVNGPSRQNFRTFLNPIRRPFTRVDLRDHEDKILLMLALVVSAVVGLIVVAFVAMTERMGRILLVAGPAQRCLSPFIGALVGGWLLYRFFPDARGSGIPQTRVALLLQKGVISGRTIVGKFICSAVSLGSGVALGREGPSVQIGAGIASVVGRRLGLSGEQVRSLIPVGTAAAVAAAFNTPLAAVLFTLEEILADLHARLVGTVVIGATTSWIVLRLILGDEPLFHVPSYQLVHPLEFVIYALLGIAGGLVSTAFVKLLLWQRAHFLRVPERCKAFTPAVGGLVVGVLALVQPGVLGVGYNLVSGALNGGMELKIMLVLLALKIVATSTSYSTGNAGGIFGPSLFIGAMLGGAVGQVAHTLLPDHTGTAGAYALVGMGAAFAGIVRTPMTSVIMIFEVTRDYTIIVPLMIANLCSYLLSQKLQKLPIYHALPGQEGIIMPSPDHLPEPLTVEQAMGPQGSPATAIADGAYVHPDDPLDAAMQRMGKAGKKEILVLSRTGARPLGILTIAGVLRAYKRSSDELEATPPSAQNWVTAIAAITVATVLIVSGLVFWQRTRQASRGSEAYRRGQQALSQGQVEAAVLDFRNALAQRPEDLKSRAALGLALVDSGHFTEASSYLSEVAKRQPQNGPVWAGLAKIALSAGDKLEAVRLFQQALTKEWPAESESGHKQIQIAYAELLADIGRRNEADSVLLSLIAQSGNDAYFGKKAADTVKAIGPPEQTEAAYAALAVRFPADSSIWLTLGDIRFAEGRDALALEAYRNAVKADSDNENAHHSVARLEDIVRLDPTQRGLSIRERARRWDLILQRILEVDAACAPSREIDRANAILKQRTTNLDTLDKKVEAVREIWDQSASSCVTDEVLSHVMSKLKQ